jgi:hypothetical protein
MMLWRAAGRPVSFPDHPWFAAAPHRLLPALRWAVANGVLVPGVVPFDATQRVNRAEIARWLQSTDAFLDRPVLPSAAPSAPPTTVVPSPTTAPPEPPPTVPEATTVP